MIKEYTTILKDFLPSYKTSGSKIVINCPCCVYMGESSNDTRSRGGIFEGFDEFGYNCFNCNYKFRFKEDDELPFRAIKFLELLGVPETEINKIHFESLKLNPNRITIPKQIKVKNSNFSFQPCELPDNTYIIHDHLLNADPNSDLFKAYVYAKERGIANNPYLLWVDQTYKNFNKRLTIPFIFNSDVVGYISRAFLAVNKSERYIDKRPDQTYMYNIEKVLAKQKYLIIGESPLDAMLSLGIGTMRSNLSLKQIEILRSFKGKIIVHPDLNHNGLNLIDIAINEGWSVYFNDYGDDLGDSIQKFGRIFIIEDIIQNHLSDPLEIELRKNML